jgi:hypothetical protein
MDGAGLSDGAGVVIGAGEALGDDVDEGSGDALAVLGEAEGAGVTEALVQPTATLMLTNHVAMILNIFGPPLRSGGPPGAGHHTLQPAAVLRRADPRSPGCRHADRPHGSGCRFRAGPFVVEAKGRRGDPDLRPTEEHRP